MPWWFIWLPVMILLFMIIPATQERQRRLAALAKRNRMKLKKGELAMNELIKEYVGKEIIAWTYSSSGVTGTVTRIEENWIEIKDKDGNLQLLNVDHISRIQEYPKNKNGKKKVVIV